MIPTEKLKAEIDRQRWTADPETEAALSFIMDVITRPESDGRSMLERVYLACDHEAQRDEEIQTAGFAILQERFRDAHCFFQADCPNDGRCRFRLRIADTAHELRDAVPAKREFNINLLKPEDEWIRGPLVLTDAHKLPKQKPEPQAPAGKKKLKLDLNRR